MDEARWKQQPSKTLGAHNIQITAEYLSLNYLEPTVPLEIEALSTGLVELFRIEPRISDLPTFSIRWDHRDEFIDVDLLADGEGPKRFKKGDPGYRGHHTRKRGNGPRTYEIDIETPLTGPVFKGLITLSIFFGQLIAANVTFGFECNAEVIRDGKPVGNK
jgi:hypothetical protein